MKNLKVKLWLSLLHFICIIYVSNVYAASPEVRQFSWSPAVIGVGQYTTFYWDIRNVKRCYSTTSGPGLTERAASGSVGPVYGNVPAVITSKWYCIDLDGNRFPQNPSAYLEATRTVVSALHTVSVSTGQGGTASPSTHQVINGDTTTISFAAYKDYKLKEVTGCGGSLNGTKFTTGKVTANCQIKAVFYPLPKVEKFAWVPDNVEAGEETYFHWNVKNIQKCITTASDPTDKDRAGSGTIGPVVINTPSTYTSKWYCIDLAGQRFPVNSNSYLEATRTVTEVTPKPIVKQFEWLPAEVGVGQETYFHWNIENVQQCFTTASDPENKERQPSGTIGPVVLSEPAVYTSKWYCIDLKGNRFPENANTFLEAKRTVTELKPVVRQFEWIPDKVDVNKETYFHWNIENVRECFTTASDPENKQREPAGIIGPVVLVEPAVYTSRWYCIDLAGNRFPSDPNSFLEATRTIIASEQNKSSVIYLHTDVLGSVIAESDQNGDIIKITDYKPFGGNKGY